MNQRPHDPPRIYLDNAATSWPKPDAVYAAVDHYNRHLGAPAGRGGYSEAVEVNQAVDRARRHVAQLLGLDDPAHLIFTANGTDSLNLVIHGLLRPGDHVIASVVEHNSVLRPLETLRKAGVIELTLVGASRVGVVDLADIQAAIRPATRLIALSHASNVTGALQPIAEVGKMARAAGILMLCDAAQTAGHDRVDLGELHVDFLAASGHKGLLGPLGMGVLAIRPAAAPFLRSVRQGGTGTQSEQTQQPDTLPAKFESGNLNVPGILGLGAAADFIHKLSVEAIHEQGHVLTHKLLEGFARIEGVRVLGPATASERAPLVSIVVEGYDPQEVALGLDSAYRIQVRPGLHCAPQMHRSLGTLERGGTVRFSLGAFTTEAQIEAAVAAVEQISKTQP